MGKEILTFGNIEIEKHKLYHYFSGDADIDNASVSNKISFGEKNYKCFVGL